MKDEEYIFRQDVKERASTGRSARSRRTHCGKGGRVKLPSDYMTKKEIKAMSGECKSYKLNEPMNWKEFNAMPDDIKISYVKLLRQKFNVPNNKIAEMLGISQVTFSKEINRLGISEGKNRGSRTQWDQEGFLMWSKGVPIEQAAMPTEEPTEDSGTGMETDAVLDVLSKTPMPFAVPKLGHMTLSGDAFEISNTIKCLLGAAKVEMRVEWRVVDNG